MKEYLVTYYCSKKGHLTVKANSEGEALKIASETDTDEFDWLENPCDEEVVEVDE